MLTRRKTLFRSLPFRATYSSKMNAQMPHTNNCIVCTVIIPSFSISVSLSLFIYVFLFSLPFRFVCFLLWWWYWYFSSIMILHLVTKCTKCGALAFLLLLFYYIIMCVGAASFSTFFAFASFSSFSVTPLVRERANRVALIHFSSLQSIPSWCDSVYLFALDIVPGRFYSVFSACAHVVGTFSGT